MVLDPRQTIIVGILVLFLGKFLNKKINLLRQYNIPEPVTGGIIASVFFAILYLLFGFDLEFSNHYRDILLVVFFPSIGLSTELGRIIKGGRLLLFLTVLAIVFLFAQNFIGILMAILFKIDPDVGILTGSGSLQGGHGNIVAWAPPVGESVQCNKCHGNRHDHRHVWVDSGRDYRGTRRELLDPEIQTGTW